MRAYRHILILANRCSHYRAVTIFVRNIVAADVIAIRPCQNIQELRGECRGEDTEYEERPPNGTYQLRTENLAAVSSVDKNVEKFD